MRRLLLIPAALLLVLGGPVLALESPDPGVPTVDETPVTPTDQAVPPGVVSAVAPIEGQIVGVSWEGDPDAEFTIEVQTADGTWTPAATVESDTGPDGTTAEGQHVEAMTDSTSEPVWVGDDATAVRVTLDSGSVTDVSVTDVDSAPPDASGATAGALGGLLPTIDGPARYFFAGALVAVVGLLVALAFGWSPWRGGRRRSLALVLVLVAALGLAACRPAPTSNGSVQPGIIGRAQWGAAPFGTGPVGCSAPEYANRLRFAVVHHTVNSNSYSPSQSASMVRGIQAFHMNSNGYCDIAYNFVVDRYGQIFEGRAGGIDKPVIGGHAGGFNTGSVGIALLGDFTSVKPTNEQWVALSHLLRWRLSVGRVDPGQGFTHTVLSSPCNCQQWPVGTTVTLPNAIVGHRDVDKSSCPGNAFYPELVELRLQAQAGVVIPPAAEVSLGSAVAQGVDDVAVFTRAPGGAVVQRSFDGSSWSTPPALGGIATSRIVAVAPTPTTAVVMTRGEENALWSKVFDGSAWSGWISAGGFLTSDPAAVVDSAGNVNAFVRGGDKALYRNVFTSATSTWSGWSSLGGVLSSDPAVTRDGSGRIVLVVRSAYALFAGRIETTGAWSGWSGLGGWTGSDPGIVTDAAGRVWSFVIGSDREVYTSRLDGVSWSPWTSLGGFVNSDPDAVLDSAGKVHLFVRSSDSAFYERVLTGDTWSSNWVSLGGVTTSDPASVRSGGQIVLFARGAEHNFWFRRYNGTVWTDWATLGGPVDSVRGAASA